jgi:DNA-binding NarL/FixJ family response regulator
MEPIRVLLVDDHPVVRQGLETMLSIEQDIQVVGKAGDGPGALQQVVDLEPDVVLLDIRLPDITGVELLHQFQQAAPQVKVIILTTYDDEEYLLGALRAGARGYLLKTVAREQLTAAIRAAYHGEHLIGPSLMEKVLRQVDAGVERAREAVTLSQEEIRVLRLVSEGATNKEIADQLCYSEITIKRKLQEIFVRLGATNRAQAVAEALRRGLI